MRQSLALISLLLVFAAAPVWPQAAGPVPQKRRVEPVQDLADAPPPKRASAGAREAFDRARQNLQRTRALNQQGNARRADGAEPGDAAPRPGPRPKTPKAR